MADAYHSCYVLAGLSSAQHLWTYNAPDSPKQPLSSAYNWSVSTAVPGEQVFDEEDRVGPLHPVFVIPEGVAERVRAHFERPGNVWLK
jgi:protein farnesyltransferase subunit beta